MLSEILLLFLNFVFGIILVGFFFITFCVKFTQRNRTTSWYTLCTDQSFSWPDLKVVKENEIIFRSRMMHG